MSAYEGKDLVFYVTKRIARTYNIQERGISYWRPFPAAVERRGRV